MASLDVTLKCSSSKLSNHLICGIELPSPKAGYPTLDILGCATSTISNSEYNSTEIANALSKRLTLELGIKIDESYLLDSINHFEKDSMSANHLTSSTSSPNQAEVVDETEDLSSSLGNCNISSSDTDLVRTSHFVKRTHDPKRATDKQSMNVLNSSNAAESSTSSRHKGAIRRVFKTEKGVVVIYDVHENKDGTEKWVIITTFKKLRQQLVLVLEGDLGERVLAHRETLHPIQRCEKARKMGSGVSDIILLSYDDINNLPIEPILGDNLSEIDDNWRIWANTRVPEETKEYSMVVKEIDDSSINPDFGKLYHSALKDNLLSVLNTTPPPCNDDEDSIKLSPFSRHVANHIPTLYWGGKSLSLIHI